MNNKCIVKLKGGLGNQLFQLAFGLWFADGDEERVYLDLSYFEKDSRHGGYALENLFSRKFKSASNIKFKDKHINICLDNSVDGFYPNLKYLETNAVFDGYFQNINYVLPNISLIQKWYNNSSFDESGQNESSSNYLGVHIRRGDYLNSNIRSNFGLVSENVVKKLVEKITNSDQALVPILFSDCKDLKIPGIERCVGTKQSAKVASDLYEFQKMAKCRQLICSNSTFSFWAGLISTCNQFSYLPDPWFLSGEVKTSSLLHSRSIVYPLNSESD